MKSRHTCVGIDKDKWLINKKPTYERRKYKGSKIEGLLFCSRMINAIFDDENEITRNLWRYPDTGRWDPNRNTKEFVAAMPEYRAHGLLGFTVGLQGGSPVGYYRDPSLVREKLESLGVKASDEEIWSDVPSPKFQPWHNSAFDRDGRLKQSYMDRLTWILDRADELGMIVILVLFYAGQDERLRNESAVKRAVVETCKWILNHGYTNVVIEINNECDVPGYEHEILQPHRVHELIELAKGIKQEGRRLYVGTSYARTLPDDTVVEASDIIFLHGNAIDDPMGIVDLVNRVRALPSYRPMPIVFDEDDHYDFDKPMNNFLAAISCYAGWGFFDNAGGKGCQSFGDYKHGYQNIPVNWGISSERKRKFFNLLREVTGGY